MLNFDTPEVFAVALKFVRRRCSHLNEEELQDAASAWIGYMKVVWRIHERVEAEKGLVSEVQDVDGSAELHRKSQEVAQLAP